MCAFRTRSADKATFDSVGFSHAISEPVEGQVRDDRQSASGD